jgi:hypothetical protein
MVVLGTLSCGDGGGVGPGALRFGQVGQITISLDTPLGLGVGTLSQTLQWQSSGAWSFRESISYRGLIGDETFRRNPGDPAAFALGYAQLITRVNEAEGLKLFIDELPVGIDAEECGPTLTRLTFSIRDDPTADDVTWTQCADGSLSRITPVGAGPNPAAARLVIATQQSRDATVGVDFLSVYRGSVPFGTLARGEDTDAAPTAPFVVTDQAAWEAFWLEHAGSTDAPEVDFGAEMVIVGAVGERDEAGDSVEIRRVLRIDKGTLTEIFERVPGDFCTPAARSHFPFHVIVSPVTPSPIRFADIRTEEVPCGG